MKIYHPEGGLPYTANVTIPNASSHIAANDQWAAEAAILLDYHEGNWEHWTDTDSGVEDGVDWAEYEYDHEAAKRSIRTSAWDTVTTYGATYADGDGTGACDVSVQIAEANGRWYLRTYDDAGGSDSCDATAHDDRDAAVSAAEDYATEHDECDALSAAEWLEREATAAIEAGKSVDGEYVLAHKDGTRWDDDRYADEATAKAAIAAWYDDVQAANPGTNIIWHLMDYPVLAKIDESGAIEVIADEE